MFQKSQSDLHLGDKEVVRCGFLLTTGLKVRAGQGLRPGLISPWDRGLEEASFTLLLEGRTHVHSQPATTYRYPCPRHWSPSRHGMCVFTSKLSMWAATVYDVRRGVWTGAVGEQVLRA